MSAPSSPTNHPEGGEPSAPGTDGDNSSLSTDAYLSPKPSLWVRIHSLAQPGRTAYRVVAALTVAPIIVAAVRAGLGGWIPAHDAAPTVVRAQFAISFHPSLVGMFTDASNWSHAATYFAGPWQLWWMAIPIRVLGTTWGPLLSMALLNSVWMLLAGWFVKRRLGYRAAIGALVFLAASNWTLGMSALYTPVPMVMVVPAFAAFLFGIWALAVGDEGVLPALALLANFLLLDHLVLTFLVPAIGGAGLIIWVVGLIWQRGHQSDSWPAVRHRSVRALAGAAIVTVVMWIPSVVQQFTSSPGNLGNLFLAAGKQPSSDIPLSTAYTALIDLFTQPPFWLRDSRTHSFIARTATAPSWGLQIGVGVALGVVSVAIAVLAWRRRDRIAFTSGVLAAVVFAATWANMVRSPTDLGVLVRHYLSIWPAAMFITFLLAIGLGRLLPVRVKSGSTIAALGLAVVLALANLPHANFSESTTMASDATISSSARVNAQVLAAVKGKGRVAIARPRGNTYPWTASLVVALHDAGIPLCITDIDQFLGSPIPECSKHWGDVVIGYVPENHTSRLASDTNVIARYSPLNAAEQHQFRTLTRRIAAAVAASDHLELTEEYRDLVRQVVKPGRTRNMYLAPAFLKAPGGPMGASASRSAFADLIMSVDTVTHGSGTMVVSLPGISEGDFVTWAKLQREWSPNAFIVTLGDRRR